MFKKLPHTFSYFDDIKFWIGLYFVVRLFGIGNPPIEIGHNWRQVTNYMVERNFLENNNNILYPRVDDNQGKSGVIGMEFPVLQYMAYLLAAVFGNHFIWGRLLNLLISSIGIFYFYKISNHFFGHKTALYSGLILLCSVWFEYGRKFMADTFCISLIFIGIYYCILFLKHNKWQYYFLFFIFSTLAVLSKIPAGIYFSLIIFPLFNSKINLRQKILLVIALVVALTAVYEWYFVWCVDSAIQSGTWYNIGFSLSEGTKEISTHLYDTFEKFYFCSFNSFIILFVFIGGLYLIVKTKQKSFVLVLLVLSGTFLFYILKSGHFFYTQSYYIVPFVPIMALVVGIFIASISNKKIVVCILVFGSIEAIANQYHDLFNPREELYKLKIENIVNEFIPKDKLVVVNGGKNPQLLYFTHRKGWTLEQDELNNETNESLKGKNCRYILIDKHIEKYAPLNSNFSKIFENVDLLILKIKM